MDRQRLGLREEHVPEAVLLFVRNGIAFLRPNKVLPHVQGLGVALFSALDRVGLLVVIVAPIPPAEQTRPERRLFLLLRLLFHRFLGRGLGDAGRRRRGCADILVGRRTSGERATDIRPLGRPPLRLASGACHQNRRQHNE